MMKIAVLVVSILLSACSAWAWTDVLSINPVPGATSYKVEKSTDNGATWTTAGTPIVPSLSYTGTEPGLVLFRWTSCNSVGCTTRYGVGTYHDESKMPPAAAVNIGVQ